MKTDINRPEYAEELARFLSDEMNSDEEQVFINKISATKEDMNKLHTMKRQWTSLGKYNEANIPDSATAWKNLRSRLEQDNLIPAQRSERRSGVLPRILKTAAVIFLLAGIGAILYFSTSKTAGPEMVKINTKSELNTFIKTLSDGSVIYIAQNSQFSFPAEFETNSRNVELNGEAFFDIAHNPGKPFIVETDETLIEVLGTAFNVKTKNGKKFELNVDKGKVKVTLKSNPSVFQYVAAGEQLVVVNNNLVKSKQSGPDSYWYRQRMHFKDEQLQSIIDVLNRNFNTTFAVEEKEVGTRRMTVTFLNESPETMTELLCASMNLKSHSVNGAIVLSEKKESAK